MVEVFTVDTTLNDGNQIFLDRLLPYMVHFRYAQIINKLTKASALSGYHLQGLRKIVSSSSSSPKFRSLFSFSNSLSLSKASFTLSGVSLNSFSAISLVSGDSSVLRSNRNSLELIVNTLTCKTIEDLIL